jgi:hypothetical protein
MEQPVAITDGWKPCHIQINAIAKPFRTLQQLHTCSAEFHSFPLPFVGDNVNFTLAGSKK